MKQSDIRICTTTVKLMWIKDYTLNPTWICTNRETQKALGLPPPTAVISFR